MTPPQQLGPYRLIERIGKGGMGEVWKASDTRLDREVAVKISAEQFSDRFEREARAIAALNHPNICTLFDVGPNYLVMELIDGPTLTDRIAEGAIPLEEALGIARQIADALEAAHEKNIVHRDLKPGNIKVRPDGSVKVLDFGLAKAGLPGAEVSHDSPTLVHSPTLVGVILGTAAYMAPEQARGKVVDKRADIWSFGVVLHEMLTGTRTFEGEDLTETLASVVKSDPDLTVIPHKVRRLLAKCLQKDPKKRLRDIGDVWELLDDSHASATALLPSRLRMVWPVVAGLLALALAALTFVHFRQTAPTQLVVRSSILPPPNSSFYAGYGPREFAISPAGDSVAEVVQLANGRRQLLLRPLDSLESRQLADFDASDPFWSPDGRYLCVLNEAGLRRIDVAGGAVLDLTLDTNLWGGGTWNQSGTILFARGNTGLYRIPASGGAIAQVLKPGGNEVSLTSPHFLPDGTHFVFTAVQASGHRTVRAGSLNSTATRDLTETNSDGLFAPDPRSTTAGYLLFTRGQTVLAQPLDLGTQGLKGEAATVLQFRRPGSSMPLSVSATGTIVYTSGSPQYQLAWFDAQGKRTPFPAEPADYGSVDFSPDYRTVGSGIGSPGTFVVDLWLLDAERGLRTRFTSTSADHSNTIWSPDSRTIAFASNPKGVYDLYRKQATGAAEEELLYSDKLDKIPMAFSPDGKNLLYIAGTTTFDLWVLREPLAKPGTATPSRLVQIGSPTFGIDGAAFSPDGRWVVYSAGDSGRKELYVTPFPGPGSQRQISTTGGHLPRWRRDGNEIFYLDADQYMVGSAVTSKNGEIDFGAAERLFGPVPIYYGYDVTADGRRFLAAVPPEQGNAEPLTLLQNWQAGLKK